jgi:hypothetical protein
LRTVEFYRTNRSAVPVKWVSAEVLRVDCEAARCKVTPCRVSSWLAGDSRPNDTARVALEANYRIVASAWDEPAVR